MDERKRDRQLRIKTDGLREWQQQSVHYNRYEATPYEGLDALFEEYSMPQGRFVDFGCGKGRVPFYVHHRFGMDVTGVEMKGQLYQEAFENLMNYKETFPKRKGTVTFECCLAEAFPIPSDAAVFYFFNPFSAAIFRTVVDAVLDSVEQTKRTVDIILYYPTAEYEEYLASHPAFRLIHEIPIVHLHFHDKRERFVVYRCE